MNLFTDINLNIQYLNEVFKDCGDIVKRKFPVGEDGRNVFVIYIDMLIDRKLIELNIIGRLMYDIRLTPEKEGADPRDGVYESLKNGGITTADLKDEENFENVAMAILSGDTAIFVDGFAKAVVVSTKGWPNRGIPKTETEVVVQGSKEAFSEVFRFNTVLIRRRIRDVNLKVKQMKMGRRSGTDIAIMYLDDVVRKEILEEVEKRLQEIDIDGILDAGSLEEFIGDNWMSPFPQIQITERPDKAASAILEGRIVVVVDNSPVVLIVPTTVNSFFQSSEDYYQRFDIMSFARIIRFIAAFFAVAMPGIYIALAVFHPSMIPMMLAFKMAGAHENVPFPAVIEILIMEFAFELLREAGIRLPNPVGSAIGIVGGLIVGQAAVEAGIVSPVVVIIVALTGISSFAIPNYTLVSGFRLTKYLVIILSAVLGFFGFWVAMLLILIHLASLKSFGIPYLYPFVSGDINGNTDFKDSIFRAPMIFMKKRPFFANPEQSVRMRSSRKDNKKSGKKNKK